MNYEYFKISCITAEFAEEKISNFGDVIYEEILGRTGWARVAPDDVEEEEEEATARGRD